jgi:hypothetical protein
MTDFLKTRPPRHLKTDVHTLPSLPWAIRTKRRQSEGIVTGTRPVHLFKDQKAFSFFFPDPVNFPKIIHHVTADASDCGFQSPFRQ